MIVFLMVYLVSQKIMRSTGRISPAWGILSIFITYFFIFLVTPLFYFYANKYIDFTSYSYEDKENSRLALVFIIQCFSGLLAILIVFIIGISVKPVKYRNKLKKTKLNYKYIGWMAIALIMIPSIYGFFLRPPNITNMFMITTSTIFMLVISISCFRWHRMTMLVQLQEKLDNDTRPYVLLLRSFNECKSKVINIKKPLIEFIPQSSYFENTFVGYTLDELITPILDNKVGPTVSLGDPNDYLPEFGSSKLYVPDQAPDNQECWWDIAVELIKRAGIIIVIESSGDNVFRELYFIRKNIDPRKVYIITYPSPFSVNERLWYDFYCICKCAKIIVPTVSQSGGTVITFDSRWEYNTSKIFNDDIIGLVEYIKRSTSNHRCNLPKLKH